MNFNHQENKRSTAASQKMSGRLSVILKRLTEDEIRKWTRSSSSASQQPENPAAKKIKRVQVKRPKFLNRSLNSFPCPKCNLIFFKRTSLETHVQNVHLNKLCPVKSDSSEALTCDFCRQKTTSLHKMEQHISKVHLVKKEMHCPRCSKIFLDRDTYLKHVETDHKQMFSCPHCGRTDAPITGHIINRKVCFTCKKKFFCLTSLSRHEQQCRLQDSRGRKFSEFFYSDKCRLCLEVVVLVADRRRHLLRKHAKDLFPCPEHKCLRFFMKPEYLDHHQCKACPICKQSFHRLASLAIHEERCQKDYSKGSTLTKFFMKKTFACRMCSEVVLLFKNRRRHLLEKHSKEVFPCLEPKCPLFFMKPEFLDQHLCPWKKKENETTQDQVKRSKLDGRMPCSFFRNKSLACRMCSEVVISIQDRRRHLLEEHSKDVFPCPHPKCLRFFLNHEHMVQHHQKRHPPRTKVEGEAMLAGKQNKLDLKFKAKHPDEFVKCTEKECRFFFDNDAAVLAHVQKVHLEEDSSKVLLSFDSLEQQLRTCRLCHTSHVIAKSLCLRCYDNFECINNYRKHVRICKLPFKCQICGAKYFRSDSFLRHYQSSTHGVDGIKLLDTLKAAPSFEHRQNLERIHRVKSEMEEEEVVFD